MTLEEFERLSGLRSHQEVAFAIGVSLSTVDSWSEGRNPINRRTPNFESRTKMIKYLEKQNAINARHAELRRARGISDSDFRLAIETGDC